jgi:hypothetical protein
MAARSKLFLVLLATAALLHLPSIRGGFVWDDQQMIVENETLDDLGNIPSYFRTNYFGDAANVELFRPLVNVSLAIDTNLLGRAPAGYRLVNIRFSSSSIPPRRSPSRGSSRAATSWPSS